MKRLFATIGFLFMSGCADVVVEDGGAGGAGGCDASSTASDSASDSSGAAPYDADCKLTLCAGGVCKSVDLTGYACGASGNCYHGACLEPI